MQYSTLREEKKLWRKGFRVVAGIDEVGRGPLAGPVLACAIILSLSYQHTFATKDSKQLTEKQREALYRVFKKDPRVQWGISRVGAKTIDRINIYQATKLAMQ